MDYMIVKSLDDLDKNRNITFEKDLLVSTYGIQTIDEGLSNVFHCLAMLIELQFLSYYQR